MNLHPHPLIKGPNTIYGDKVLSILQDQSTPLMDLLVREAIQNSLDAASDSDKPVQVSINLRELDTNGLMETMGLLPSEYKELATKQKVLEIRDSGTTGLTGERTMDSVQETNLAGNFIKLVFSLGVNQTKEAAGGSWGFGKTIFYRPGSGLVFYYSKLQTGESRLAACWVEDQNKSEGILRKSEIKTGVCWWGKKSIGIYLEPVTDEVEISEVLELLTSIPFGQDESGTAIIIPFLNEEFVNSFNDSALKLSVMKWYGPRLFSTWKDSSMIIGAGPRLIVKINNNCINPNEERFFSIVNLLHVYAIQGRIFKCEGFDPADFPPETSWHREEINYKKKVLGWLAWVELNGKDLKLPNGFKSPDEILFLKEAFSDTETEEQLDTPTGGRNGGGAPLLLMSRSPGMVIQYATKIDWVSRANTMPDSWLIGFFVVNSSDKEIENYFRSCEYAIHNDWVHPSSGSSKDATAAPDYVKHVQKAIRGTFSKRLKTKIDNSVRQQAFSISRQIARIFMPKDGFGTGASSDISLNPPIEAKVGGKHSRKAALKTPKIEYMGDGVFIEFIAFVPKGKSSHLEVRVVGEDRTMNAADWRNEYTNLPFPFKLADAGITSLEIVGKKGNIDEEIQLQKVHLQIDAENVSLEMETPKTWPDVEIMCMITLQMHSKDFSFALEFRRV